MLNKISKIGNEKAGILLGLFAMAVFSITDGIWKYALQHSTISVVICLTSLGSAISVLAYARSAKKSLRPRNWQNVGIFCVFHVAEQLLFIYALNHMPMTQLFVIILTTPLFVLVSARFLLAESLSFWQTASVVSGFGGALIVVLARATDAGAAHPSVFGTTAIVAALANVMVGGSKILFMRRYCRDENGYCMTLCVAVLFVIGGFLYAPIALSHLSLKFGGFLAASGILSTIGMIAYVEATQKAKAPLMAATQYSQIVWAILMGILIFHEPLPLAAIAGAALIILSGIFLYSKNKYEIAAAP